MFSIALFVNFSGTPNLSPLRYYYCLNPRISVETEGFEHLGKDMTLQNGNLRKSNKKNHKAQVSIT